MAIRPIQFTTAENNSNKRNNQNCVSFGSANPVITLMDAIDRGGFAASFILQDFLGMAAPRIGTGLTRNSDKTGHLNWDFAKKEGIREVLSGPSAFLIPAGILAVIKKVSGKANNVPIDFINGLGETFSNYAQNNVSNITKKGYYKEVFKNILKTSTDNAKLTDQELETVFKNILGTSNNSSLKGKGFDEVAEYFTDSCLKIENSKSKSFWKNLTGKPVVNSTQDLTQKLSDDFIEIRKKFLGAPKDKIAVEFTKSDKVISTPFKTFLTHMKDYTEDAISNTNKKLKQNPNENIKEFVKKFSHKRSGTRFLTNMSMLLAVIGFYTLIPKLYNAATKGRDPGLDGLITNDKNKQTQNPSFTGGFSSAVTKFGKNVSENQGLLKKISNIFEFNGASMSVPAMVTILFGFCLPPRLKNAQSNTDRKEILFRDVTSFSAILFGAKALTKVFSNIFSKISGLALNKKPEGKESIFKKIVNYLNPSGGFYVLDSERITAYYSNVDNFKNGVSDMLRFIDTHGGNVGKALNIDKNIQKEATTILGKKPNANMKSDDIIRKFEEQKDSKAYKKIVKILSDKNNTLVKKAKTYNSAFGFASTILLIPALMIWISKKCESMTKTRIEKEIKEYTKRRNELTRKITNTPTMQGFLKD